ncbi:tetratricopeptide repeat protein [Candidatus Omnitrophota bacterium]
MIDKPVFFIVCIWIVAICCFFPSFDNGFTNWDDKVHILENPHVPALSLKNSVQIFQSTVNGTYIPLTILSFAIEYHFFADNPFIYHFNNVLLHLGVVALVFIFAQRCGLSQVAAALASLLFAIHPMHVESVVWITERKDVLYAFFYMLSLNAYVQYLKSNRYKPYVFSLLWALLSILSKPMALSLPFVLFLCDWFFRRRKCVRMVIDKIPYVLFIVPITLITYLTFARIPGRNVSEGLFIWVWTLTFYLKKFCWPWNLSPLYDIPLPVSITNPEYFFSFGLLGVCLFLLLRCWRNRLFVFSFFFYFCSIFFLCRFDVVDDASVVADRFMYLPSLGFCLLAGVGVESGLNIVKRKGRVLQLLCKGVLVIVVAGIFFKSFTQCDAWQDSFRLWTTIIERYPNIALPYNNRGNVYARNKQQTLALLDYNKAIGLNPRYEKAYYNRGLTYQKLKEHEKAVEDLTFALNLNKEHLQIYYDRAVSLIRQNKNLQALEDLNRFLEYNPDFLDAYNNRGVVYGVLGRYGAAVNDFTKMLSMDADNAGAYYNRSRAFEAMGEYSRALKDALQSKALGFKITNRYVEGLKKKVGNQEK